MKKLSLFILTVLLLVSQTVAARSSNVLVTEEISRENPSCPRPAPSKQLSCYTYHQTTTYTCGPAVIMTLMRYYGKLSSGEMNRTTEMRIAQEMGVTPNEGVTQSQMESWLESHGFSVSSGTYVSSEDIINNIDRGIPTIISYNQHWIMAKGYKKKNPSAYENSDQLYFSDSCCGTSVIPSDILDGVWGSNAVNRKSCNRSGNFGEYLVATPR